MQIIVLSMHRSGSSMVARLINLMGAYFAPEGAGTGASVENPKGFWERKDIRKVNDNALFAAGADWYRVSGWAPHKLPSEAVQEFEQEAGRIVLNMDAYRPWVAKEPRFCLLFPMWRRLLEAPVCVHVYRSPLEVARSLKTRNGFPIPFGIALWAYYCHLSLQVSSGLPRTLVRHSDLMANPVGVVETLYESLTAMGVRGLKMPSSREIRAFIEPKYWREKAGRREADHLLTPFQRQLASAFETGQVFRFTVPPEIDAKTIESLRFHEQEADLAKKYGVRAGDLDGSADLSAALHLEIIHRQHQKMRQLLE